MVFTPCSDLVGRDAELRIADAALADASGGQGGLLVLAGEPGVGKSRLAAEVAQRARARGFVVLTGRATASVVPAPLRPVSEALMGWARGRRIPDADEIAPYCAVLASVVPEWRGGNEPDGGASLLSPLALGEALLRVLGSAAGGGALLRLEDVQWADPETLAVLEYLVDSLEVSRIACVATLRTDVQSAGADLVWSLQRRRVATVVEVTRLPSRELERMAAACLGSRKVPADMIRQVIAEADGLPFALEEILAAAVAAGDLVPEGDGWRAGREGPAEIPASIADAVRRRLDRLDAVSADVITHAAVLGRWFDWTLLPGLVGMSEKKVLAALKQARDAQLIEPQYPGCRILRFRHSLTRQAIVSALFAPELAARSARAATAVEAAGEGLAAEWRELAAELYRAAGQVERGAGLLVDAGQLALNLGAVANATALLTRARDMALQAASPDPRLLIAIDRPLTTALSIVGDTSQLLPAATRLLAELEAAGSAPAVRAQVRLRLAYAFSPVHATTAATHLAAACEIVDGTHDAPLAAEADAVAARCALDSGDQDRARDLAQRSLAAAEAAGLESWAAGTGCEALMIIGRVERAHDPGAAQNCLQRAHQIASQDGLAIHRIRALHEVSSIKALQSARPDDLSLAARLAAESGILPTLAMTRLQQAETLIAGTDLDRALAIAAECQRTASRAGLRRVEALAISVRACALAIRTGQQDAEGAAAEAEATLPGDPAVLASTWGQARVIAAIFNDDLKSGLAAATTGVWHARKDLRTSPFMVWGFWALLQAAHGENGSEAIRQARAAGAELGRWNRGCLAYAQAVLEGRRRNARRASKLAGRAAADFRSFAPWWNHALHRIVAPAAICDGWGQPAAWLHAAIPDLQASRHDSLASACRSILRQAGEPCPRRGRGSARVPPQLRQHGITTREMDVFLLVGQGCSTAEIASRLFISAKTVETHIANLVAKTGRCGRRDLIAFAARQTAP